MVFNLKDPKNAYLRTNLLNGSLAPSAFAHMSVQEIANPDKQVTTSLPSPLSPSPPLSPLPSPLSPLPSPLSPLPSRERANLYCYPNNRKNDTSWKRRRWKRPSFKHCLRDRLVQEREREEREEGGR